MAHPLFYLNKVFFYAMGNTPAVCLTDALSPEEPANILLLGCGDPRNILFTVYSGGVANPPRPLDFTCCDIEPAVLARNVIQLSMILDDTPQKVIWDTFFHFRIDKATLATLIEQCEKLLVASKDMDTWRASPYGTIFRMCTLSTLQDLRRHWSLYVKTSTFSPAERQKFETSFVSKMKPFEDGLITTAARSAGPHWADSIQPITASYTRFWEKGVLALSNAGPAPTCCNPTFGYSIMGEGFHAHYGSDPLLGFHLAPTFAELESQTKKKKAKETVADALVRTVQSQFRAWCSAFKAGLRHTVVRFFAGDALALCQAMHAKLSDTTGPITYTAPWKSTVLELDSGDSTAPFSFNVVDTSNLSDHVGLINLLVSVVPLLVRSPSTTFYTETLLPVMGKDTTTAITDRLFTTFPVLSLLIGLTPCDYLSSFTSNCATGEILRYRSMGHDDAQFHERLGWKITELGDRRAGEHRVEFDPPTLTRLLYDIYIKMFEEEDIMGSMQKMNLGAKGLMGSAALRSVFHYTRGTVARLLKVVRERLRADEASWEKVMAPFFTMLIADRRFMMGANNVQDFYGALDLLGVREPEYKISAAESQRVPYQGWSKVPTLVCVVLVVPRDVLRILDETVEEIGTPILQCDVLGPNFLNVFSDIKVVYGDVRSIGTKDEKEVLIDAKRDGPNVIAFFWMPSWILAKSPSTTSISLNVRSTPSTVFLLPRLGMQMQLFKADLLDSKRVHVVTQRPGLPGERETHRVSAVANLPGRKVTAKLSSNVMTLSARIEVNAPAPVVETFQKGAVVTTTQPSPYSIQVSFPGFAENATFPFPVQEQNLKLRVARKSRYIEVEAPLAVNHGRLSLDPFPIVYGMPGRNVVPWNIHRVNLDRCPVLARPLSEKQSQTVHMHLKTVLSDREANECSTTRSSSGTVAASTDDLVNVKESLQNLVVEFAKREGPMAFGLTDRTMGGVNTLLLMMDLRLDLASHTFVANGYALPLTTTIMDSPGFQGSILPKIITRGMMHIHTSGNEWKAWKQLLPALVERCRTWEHGPTCEYLVAEGSSPKAAPLVEFDKSPLCSCGLGKVSKAFDKIKEWIPVASLATQIAISPFFPVAYVDTVGESILKMVKKEIKSPVSPPPTPSATQCTRCRGPGKPQLRACSICKDTLYCSPSCQTDDWKAHKRVCSKK